MTGAALISHIAVALAAAVVGWVLGPILVRIAAHGCGRAVGGVLSPAALRAIAAAVFGVVGAAAGWQADLVAWLVFAAGAITLSLTDLATHRLPNRLVAGFSAAAIAALGCAAVATADPQRGLRAVLAGALLLVGFGLLALLHPRGLGFGDAKLAFPIGLYLGWLGWPAVYIGVLAAFTIGAAAAIVTALVRRTGRATAIPFGPYLLGSVAVCLLLPWG